MLKKRRVREASSAWVGGSVSVTSAFGGANGLWCSIVHSFRARQRAQIIPAVLINEITAFLVPRTQHDALGRFAIHHGVVDAGAMRVAVDHPPHACSTKRCFYRLR